MVCVSWRPCQQVRSHRSISSNCPGRQAHTLENLFCLGLNKLKLTYMTTPDVETLQS